MSPNIRVDSDVYMALQKRATAFVDTPNSVLRRLLNLDAELQASDELSQKVPNSVAPAGRSKRKKSRGSRRTRGATRPSEPRLPAGALLPEDEYKMPLLTTLAERGGSAAVREVIEAVGKKLAEKLTATDKQKTSSGAIRWENRLQFVRLKLVEEGLLVKGSPRGIWALSDKGRAHLNGQVRVQASRT